jgi:hypothetical protein
MELGFHCTTMLQTYISARRCGVKQSPSRHGPLPRRLQLSKERDGIKDTHQTVTNIKEYKEGDVTGCLRDREGAL